MTEIKAWQSKKRPLTDTANNKRRGISQLIGTLLMLAVVASIGSVILFQGITKINDFNFALAVLKDQGAESTGENMVIEHVRFNPTGTDVTFHVRNIGISAGTITTVTVVKLDTQELIISNNTLSTEIFANELVSIQKTASLSLATQWDDSDYKTSEYRISIITQRGNVFEKVATPFNA